MWQWGGRIHLWCIWVRRWQHIPPKQQRIHRIQVRGRQCGFKLPGQALNLSESSMNGSSIKKPTSNTSEASSNYTITPSHYLQFIIISQLCGMLLLSLLMIPMHIIVYLIVFAYFILQLMRNLENISKTSNVYSKSLPIAFLAGYLLLLTYMMSASLIYSLLLLSGSISILSIWSEGFTWTVYCFTSNSDSN